MSLMVADLSYLGFCSKPDQVEKSRIKPGVELDAFCCSAERMAQAESKKIPKSVEASTHPRPVATIFRGGGMGGEGKGVRTSRTGTK